MPRLDDESEAENESPSPVAAKSKPAESFAARLLAGTAAAATSTPAHEAEDFEDE